MFDASRCRAAILAALACLPWAVAAHAQTCDNPGMCSAYDSCGVVPGSCGLSSGSCFGAADGGGVCVDGAALCDGAPDCQTAADCPEGTACTDALSCCGTPKCFPRCVPSCLPSAALGDCEEAGSASLLLRVGTDPSRSKLSWRAADAPVFPQPMPFGDPTENEAARLCVYGNDALVMGVAVAPSATRWESWGTGGFRFRDSDAQTGIAGIGEKLTAPDEALFTVKGKGEALSLPAPVDANAYFAAGTIVTVQWHVGTTCWSTTFDVDLAKKNDGTTFVAKR